MKETTYKYSRHDLAMELADAARSAKKRGAYNLAKSLFQQAFFNEKAYLSEIPSEDKFQLTRSIINRSAGWMGIKGGLFEEVQSLMKKILAETPHPSIKPELQDVLTKAEKHLVYEEPQPMDIIGTLVSADIPFGLIKIQDEKNEESYVIQVPVDFMQELVKSYWAEKVIVRGLPNPQGVISLVKIKKAA